MRKIAVLSISATFLIGCNNMNQPNRIAQLKENDSIIHINVSSNISSTSSNVHYFIDRGKEFLAIENDPKEEIAIYDLRSRLCIKEIKPQTEGPNGIGSKMNGFDIVNFDTIFVTTRGLYNKVFLIDSSATLRKKIEFDIYYQPYLPIGSLQSRRGCTANYDGNNIYLSNDFQAQTKYFDEIHNYGIGYHFDFTKNETGIIPLNHPNTTTENGEILCSHDHFLHINGRFILTYTLGHQVFVSTENGDWDSYYLKSNNITRNFHNSTATEVLDAVKQYVESPMYLALVYDKYRHVYYRFVYPGITVTKDDDVMALREFRRVFSVMIIDDEFNVLGETLMPENTYNPNMFFINEAGLWISTNHPDNPDFDEDAINFKLFTLK